MDNKNGYIEIVTTESFKNQIDIWYKAYNITREKTELYYDFLITLLDIIEDTYLGSDFILTQENAKGHFTWCFDKLISNFDKERIHFKNRGTHFEYLWIFFYDAFYISTMENEKIRIRGYFKALFDMNCKKTRSELDMLTELYKLLDQNLKK